MNLSEFMVETLELSGAELRRRYGSKLQIGTKPDQSLCTDADLASEKIILDRIARYFPDDSILSEESGESLKPTSKSQYIWIVDPLDGTANFANNYSFFAVSIARAKILPNGRMLSELGGICDPITEKIFLAESGRGATLNGTKLKFVGPDRPLEKAFLCTGFYYQKGKALVNDIERFTRIAQICQTIRRDGAAALDLALVAQGIFDGFWERGLAPWDVAAGSLLIQEAGGVVANYLNPTKNDYDFREEGIVCGRRGIVDRLGELI